MDALPPRPQGHPIWRSPLFEWGTLALVVFIVVGVVWREAREVQMMAERAAVQSTLGALRTAFVADFLKQQVKGPAARGKQSVTELNPFSLLERPAPNYAGVFYASDVAQAPQGSWVFDPTCPCIGYRPLYPWVFEPPTDLPVMWFGISTQAGPMQLQAREAYLWAGTLVR